MDLGFVSQWPMGWSRNKWPWTLDFNNGQRCWTSVANFVKSDLYFSWNHNELNERTNDRNYCANRQCSQSANLGPAAIITALDTIPLGVIKPYKLLVHIGRSNSKGQSAHAPSRFQGAWPSRWHIKCEKSMSKPFLSLASLAIMQYTQTFALHRAYKSWCFHLRPWPRTLPRWGHYGLALPRSPCVSFFAEALDPPVIVHKRE